MDPTHFGVLLVMLVMGLPKLPSAADQAVATRPL
jgi:hypothetical protein